MTCYDMRDKESTIRYIIRHEIKMDHINRVKEENDEECENADVELRSPEIKQIPHRTRRPSKRHVISDHFLIKDSSGKLFPKKDLCWLAKAWR